MARFPEGPHPFFRLSPAQPGKARCFAVERGDLVERADATFFSLSSWVEKSVFPLTTVAAHFEVRDGDHSRLPDEEITDRASGIRYLRAQDLREGEIGCDDPVFVTRRYYETVARSHIKPGYLLFSVMASIGNSAIVPDDFPAATANRAVGILVPRERNPLLTRYVFYLFATDLGTQLYNRMRKGGLQQRTNLVDVARIEFPLPPPEKQRSLVLAMDDAWAMRQAKQARADELLAGVDAFLLEALGLASPPEERRRVFAVRLAQPRAQGRLNPDYYHPERILALRTLEAASKKLASTSLASIVTFERNQIKSPEENYLSLAHVQSRTGELTDATEEAAGACFRYEANDVLFARLRPYLNKVYRTEIDGCCSPEFHVLRVKDSAVVSPDYLAAVLRSRLVLAQTVHMMTGNTHPRLSNDDVMNLRIPIPKPEVQEAVAAEVRRRREEARRLRAEADAGWQAAKRRFEEQLLGSIGPAQVKT